MQVKFTRYGGIMATAPKSKIYDIKQLEPGTVDALKAMFSEKSRHSGSTPDAFTYAIELQDDGVHKEVELSGGDVPDPVRKLLP